MLTATALAATLLPAAAHGQHHGAGAAEATRWEWGWGARAIGLVTHASPALFGESLTETYLTQPSLAAHLASPGGRLHASAMLNLEGLTLRRGELNAGIWGEGYLDRRHPHTFLHEALATARLSGGPGDRHHLTVSLGKGFAPFGTDDPMTRPLVKYPVNHHLAQILERLVLSLAFRHGPLVLEGGVFNGDEPSSPAHLGTPDRFGDSWAVRATLLPVPDLELTASHADVASPEFPAGSGLDHRKWSTAARYEVRRARGARRYALLEWARTDEYGGARRSFTFHSLLAEAAVARRETEVAVRLERTVRPEEERLSNPFRSPRPHTDANILGATRWQVATLRASREVPAAGIGLQPFVEVAHLHASETLRPSVFVPAEFYGAARMWSLSAGVRVQAGGVHQRMGRYGAAAAPAHAGRQP